MKLRDVPFAADGEAGSLPVGAGGIVAPDPWGGLHIARAGRMPEDQRGGTAVVLLHGWGARGDALAWLAQALDCPRTRFFMPAGPLPEADRGRAWWHLQTKDRPALAGETPSARLPAPHPQLQAVRAAMHTVLHTIRGRYQPEALLLAGFSQGAMLALDLAINTQGIDRVAVLSGTLLADSLAGLHTARTSRPAIFASHGRQDPVLTFAAGCRARDLLRCHGFAVNWRPFDGGHGIPRAIVEQLRRDLFEGIG